MYLPHQKNTPFMPPLQAAAASLGVNEKELKAALLYLHWIERGVFPIQATRAAELNQLAKQQNGVNEYGKKYTRIHILPKGMTALKAYFQSGEIRYLFNCE